MLRYFSIVKEGGIEIFSHEPTDPTQTLGDSLGDPQLLSGFLAAMEMFSEEVLDTSLQQIRFNGLMLYIRTYGDFSLHLFVEEELEENEVQFYFERLAEETKSVLPDVEQKESLFDNKDFHEKVGAILAPLTKDPLVGSIETLTGKRVASKIALVGLAKAGKTSIKNVFFKNWTREMARDIKPTIGVSVSEKFQVFLQEKLLLFDFGGQAAFHKKHLLREEIWKQTSAIIFVVDIQDINSFEPARTYLRKKIILKRRSYRDFPI